MIVDLNLEHTKLEIGFGGTILHLTARKLDKGGPAHTLLFINIQT